MVIRAWSLTTSRTRPNSAWAFSGCNRTQPPEAGAAEPLYLIGAMNRVMPMEKDRPWHRCVVVKRRIMHRHHRLGAYSLTGMIFPERSVDTGQSVTTRPSRTTRIPFGLVDQHVQTVRLCRADLRQMEYQRQADQRCTLVRYSASTSIVSVVAISSPCAEVHVAARPPSTLAKSGMASVLSCGLVP